MECCSAPVLFRNQDYVAILTGLSKSSNLFEDEELPATSKSLYYSKVDKTIEWKRPLELVKVPKLCVGDPRMDDLITIELENQWFVAACCSLTLDVSAWKKVVVDNHIQDFMDPKSKMKYLGIFRFNFYRFGQWVQVVVDDRLPTRDNKLIFVHAGNSNEFWSGLLEKAYAKCVVMSKKGDLISGTATSNGGGVGVAHQVLACLRSPRLYGDYESLKHGCPLDALVDFTGGVGERCELRSFDLADEVTFQRLFDKLYDAYENRAFIFCKISCMPEEQGKEGEEGLILGQWYCITAAKAVNLTPDLEPHFPGMTQLKMVRLFNPWGNKEYTGPWSNTSTEWHFTEKSQWERLGLRFKRESDFWMSYENFLRHFTHLDICHIVNTGFFSLKKSWCEHVFHSQWCQAGRSGGSNYDNLCSLLNPQFLFDVTGNVDRVMVALEQHDVRGREALHSELNSIGFHIMKVEENRKYRVHVIGERMFSSDYEAWRSMFGTVKLWRGRYVIIPGTFEEGHSGKFMLRLYSTNTANSKELFLDAPVPGCFGGPYKMVTTLRVLKCENLALPKGTRGPVDGKVVIKCEGQRVRSGVRKNNPNPEFNITGTFYRKKPNVEPIVIEVWSYRRFYCDLFLAQANFLEEAPLSGKNFTLQLYGRPSKPNVLKPGTMEVWVKSALDLASL